MLKRTALYDEHVKLQGRIVDFGGWELPVQYTGVIDEHLACRTAAGLFDVSHMGEFDCQGPGAEAFLDFALTNNVKKVAVGQAQYNVLCHETGGIVDDLIIYRRAADRFLMVVNASNTEKDFDHLQRLKTQHKEKFQDFTLINESSKFTQIAIQGPKAAQILAQLTQDPLAGVKYYHFIEGHVLQNIPAILARTGYTGEDGFEIYCDWEHGPKIWQALMTAGSPHGLKPVGLGARDTLRMEMKFPLYGHELGDEINPLEAGLGWVTKLDKPDFVGKAPLSKVKEKGSRRRLIGLKLTSRGIPRQGYEIYDATGTSKIGVITSGTQSPSTKDAIGIAYVLTANAEIGTNINVDIRGQKISAVVVATPFYKRPY